MQPMSTHPLISCLSDDAAALCWGVNVAKTESPEACPWDSISNELFPLTEGPDPLRTLLVRALSSFLFLFKPWFFFFSGGRGCGGGVPGARMSLLYSHEVGPFETHEKRKPSLPPSPAHGKRLASVLSGSQTRTGTGLACLCVIHPVWPGARCLLIVYFPSRPGR